MSPRLPNCRFECSALLDQWIANLSLGAMTDELKVVDVELEPDAEITLESDKSVRARRSVVWVELPRNCGLFMDRKILGLDDELTVIPLTTRAWMWVQTSGSVTLRAYTTERMLQRPDFAQRLREFHETYIACARLRVISSAWEAREAQQRGFQRDQLLQEEALERLQAASSGGESPPFVDVEASDLVAICRAVAEAMGATINSPGQTSEAGSPAVTVQQIARASGLRVRKVALPEKWWKHDHGPLVGFLKPDHRPVALLPASSSRYSLWRSGHRGAELVTADVALALESEAVAFYRSLPSHLTSARELLAFGLEGCRRDFLAVVAMGVLGSLVGFLAPVLTATVFDTIIPFSGRGMLVQVTIGLVVAALAATAFELTKTFAVMRIVQRGNASVQCGVWDRLLNVHVSFFRNYTAGDLAMRANGIGEISQQLRGPVTLTAISALFTSFNLALMFYYSSQLAVAGVVMITIALSSVLLLCRSQFTTQRRIQAMRGEIGGLILQMILGIGKIRTAGAEIRAFARWAMSFEKQVRAQYSGRTAEMATAIFSGVYSNLCTMILFTMVAFYSAEQHLSVGSFLAFNSAFGAFLAAVLSLSGALVSFISVIFLYERCAPILHAPLEVDAADKLSAPARLNGRVEVNQVSFRYDRNSDFVLDKVSLRVAPGEFVAVVGSSDSNHPSLAAFTLTAKSSRVWTSKASVDKWAWFFRMGS